MLIQGYPDPGEGLRLHLNENTGGCSPRVIEAIRKLTPADMATYPSYTNLVLACAKHFNVDPEWVLLTNGLDEGILMAAIGHISRARIHDAETIVLMPAFDPVLRTRRPRPARWRSVFVAKPGFELSDQGGPDGDHAAHADDLSQHAEQSDGTAHLDCGSHPDREGGAEGDRADR